MATGEWFPVLLRLRGKAEQHNLPVIWQEMEKQRLAALIERGEAVEDVN